jgi:hypothetical protein
MMYNSRSDDALKTELEYLREYVNRVFGKPLIKDTFQIQIQDIIDQKIQDYIFQRYRDWTAPELARLRDQWEVEQSTPVEQEPVRRRGRPAKVDQNGRE